MKIHDALIIELIKPDKFGKPTGDILKIVGMVTPNFFYKLEESVPYDEKNYGKLWMTPDK